MQMLSPQDKEYIKLITDGVKPSAAFREAYPDHEAVKFYLLTEKGTPQRQKASEVLKDAAKTKLGAKYIRSAMMTYQEKMEEFSSLSLKTATELVKNARSEKVRADLAIEGIRHKIGSPTVKIASKEEKVVYLTFGKPPGEVIEGETFEQDVLDDTDDN